MCVTGALRDAPRSTHFGFLLRRAAAVLLDINELELRVGLRIVRHQQGGIVGQVFLSDALEYGAGYCSRFGSALAMERLLRFIADPSGSLLAPIISANHADRCQRSCPDCLRDYSNLARHNILDWRMALDVAQLALDANARIDFSVERRRPLVDSATPPYFQALGWTASSFGGLPGARSGTRGEVVVHPLWSPTNEAVTRALTRGPSERRGCASQDTVRSASP